MIARPGRAFAFRLCLALGIIHPDYLLRRLTSAQFAEWEAYYKLEPWGFEMENFRAGQIAATIANYAGRIAGRDLDAKDFMPIGIEGRRAEVAKQRSLVDRVRAAFDTLVARSKKSRKAKE